MARSRRRRLQTLSASCYRALQRLVRGGSLNTAHREKARSSVVVQPDTDAEKSNARGAHAQLVEVERYLMKNAVGVARGATNGLVCVIFASAAARAPSP